MRRLLSLVALTAVGLLGSIHPAEAQQLQLFSDPAAFARAAGPGTAPVDFEELSDWDQYQTVAYPDVTFRSLDGNSGDLLVLSPDSLSLPALRSRVLVSNRNFNPLVLEPAKPAGAIGLDVMALPTGTGLDVVVEGTNGTQILNVPVADGGPAFVGIVATSGAITRVSVGNPAGQERFVAVDSVTVREAKLVDPLTDALNRLSAAITAGKCDGSIRDLGTSLEDKVAAARAAVEAEDRQAAAGALQLLRSQVLAQRGKKIALPRADQLVVLIDECLSLL